MLFFSRSRPGPSPLPRYSRVRIDDDGQRPTQLAMKVRRFRLRPKHVILTILGLFVLDYFGAFTHLFEKDFFKTFRYPIEGDIPYYVHQVRHGLPGSVTPLNTFNYTFLYSPKQKCKDQEPQVLFLVKSAMRNFKRRNAIRSSWGHERRFSDVTIRTVFVLGVSHEDSESVRHTQEQIDIEASNFEDIVQANFVDTYFNNTLKTMTAMRWAVENCQSAKFFTFVDDDYYVSTKNLLRYLNDPIHYPDYIIEAEEMIRQLARHLAENKSPNITESAQQIKAIERVLEEQSAYGHHSVDSRHYMAMIQSKYEELKSLVARKSPSAKQLQQVGQEIKEAMEGDSNLNHRMLLTKELPKDIKLFCGFAIQSPPLRHKISKWYVSLDEYPYHMWPKYISAGSYVLSKEALVQMFYTSWFTKLFR